MSQEIKKKKINDTSKQFLKYFNWYVNNKSFVMLFESKVHCHVELRKKSPRVLIVQYKFSEKISTLLILK